MTEIFPGRKEKDTEYVSSNYKQESFTVKDLDKSKHKMYFAAYKQYAKSNNYKLKQLTYHFIAPQVTREVYELAFVLNHAYKNIEGVNTNIKIYTFQTFLQILLSLIPSEKWFIHTQIPFNCLNKQDILLLVSDNKAIII